MRHFFSVNNAFSVKALSDVEEIDQYITTYIGRANIFKTPYHTKVPVKTCIKCTYY